MKPSLDNFACAKNYASVKKLFDLYIAHTYTCACVWEYVYA